METKNIKETALQLVSLGFIVAPSMPCGTTDRNDPSKPAKNPVGAWKDSTKSSYCVCKSVEDVERLWKKYPRANVGVFCGGESGIYCLDIDRKQNQDGFAALREIGHDLEAEIPPTIVSRTPSGGWHVYFKCSGQRKIWETQGVLVGVDIRGECTKGGLGGFAVEAPSCYQIPATKEIKHYEWIHSPSEYSIKECPDWLLDLADKATEREKRKDDKKVQDDLPKQEKPAEDSLFDEDSPDFKAAVVALTRMHESIGGSAKDSGHQPEDVLMLAVRLCRFNYRLNREASWKALNTKPSQDAKSWNERCVHEDKVTQWPWTREKFDHKFDDVEATPEKVRFLEDAQNAKQSKTESSDFEELFKKRKKLGDFADPIPDEDNPKAVFKDKFLRKGQALLINAQLGIGKSTFVSQGSENWARGKEFAGIRPAHPLSIGIFETEDDDEEVADFRNNFAVGFKREGWSDLEIGEAESGERAPVYYNVIGVDSSRFLDYLEYCVHRVQHDLIIINPAYDFIEGDFSKAEDVHLWKSRLLKLANDFGFAVLLVHHTNKVPANANDRQDWLTGTSAAYSGSGSMVLPSSCRAVLFIRPVEKKGFSGYFDIVAAKRGNRLGWRDPDGSRTIHRYMTHSPDIIYWRECTPEEVSRLTPRNKADNSAGKPNLPAGVQRVIDLCTEKGKPFETVAEYRAAIMEKYEVSDTTADNWLNKAIDTKFVRKVRVEGKQDTQVGLALHFVTEDETAEDVE